MDTPSPPTASPPTPPRWRRVWVPLASLTASAALASLLGAGAWWWSGTEGSLATGLRAAQVLLPTGTTLDSQGVQGSLRHGGQIAALQWRQEGLTLDLQHVELQLDPTRLLQGQSPLHTLHIDKLSGSDDRPPSGTPLQTLLLPLKVDLAWRVGTLQWHATPKLEATALAGHYRFDGQQHHLMLDSLQWAQGRYRGQWHLQGQAPMALDAQLQGELSWPNSPKARGPSHALQAQAQLQGTLSGQAAELTLQAQLSSPSGGPAAPQLVLQGTLHPQAPQPVVTLLAQMQHINLAPLWPGAPQTDLNGKVQARPDDDGWQLEATLDNRRTGPWDLGRVPLTQLHTRVRHHAAGWQVQALDARWPGGGVQGQGAWQAPTWQGQWHIDHLQPSQWLSTLEGPALSGQISATQAQPNHIELQAQLHPPGRADTGLNAQARWQAGTWSVSQFALHWAEAQVQGQGRWTPAQQHIEAHTQWQLPGLTARLDGQLSPRQGQGQWQIDGTDTPRLWAWLTRWPALRETLAGVPRPSTLQASGEWQGGWAAEGMQLQARAETRQLQLRTRGTLQHTAPASAWRGQLTQLQIDWHQLPGNATPGQLALQSPASWTWQPATRRLQWQAHRWLLKGPDGLAPLTVDSGDWQAAPHAGRWPLAHVRAQVANLPARWGGWLGLPPLQGDLLLQGGIDLALTERLRAQLWLERSQGDLHAGTDPPAAARVQAGLRTAGARLQVDGSQAKLLLDWDSTQAGQLNARLQTELNPAPSSTLANLWPSHAPLTGQISARLPRVGAWSWLAPPGWRVQGAVDAQVDLSGTRGEPQWNGTLQANDLAVRSAVEGVEFKQGRLRARLQKQHMLLDEFRLLGAGAQGGEVSAQGQVAWQAQAGPLWQSVHMDLLMQAKGLRVTNRVDRRLTVSGQVRAQLERGQMQLRGQLEADSAQFLLPDDSTPTLDKDVVILNKNTNTPKAVVVHSRSVMGTPDVQVLLRLGPDFQLHGQGITTRLAGEVQLSSSAATLGHPRLVGQVRTEGGRYRAYGQQLDIEQGLLQFAGPYDNPSLNILALRPNLTQRVGVRVSGTALDPRIRLYADPDMPDADKLAWLVLGRSPAAGGAESAVLQQAALVLLGGNGKSLGGELANALGFDDISLANRSTTTATGTTATGTAVTLGKRLSKDFYLAYESSVSGAFGSLFIFYDLSRKLSLRAQTGEINALDLLYSIRHD